MSSRHKTSELQDLLAQLARFFRANETSISAEHISKCLEHLPATESSALSRFSNLLSRRKRAFGPGGTQDNRRLPHAGHGQGFQPDDTQENTSSSTSHDARCNDQASLNFSDDSSDAHAQGRRIEGTGSVAAISVPGDLDTSCSGLDHSPTLFEQPASNSSATSWPTAGLVSCSLPQAETEDNGLTRTTLATCSELRFAFSTRKLLESCKTNRGAFLHAIKAANVIFPQNQGWQAALATKKENADIRDLMKIYHRFECYNIYRHVVEAGYHTGSCWIRDMRASLIDNLCRDFPHRFHDRRTANRCLKWVDQGCRYHEWAQMLGGTSDLGYLIALPSDVSHSAYTSRCTKEQMSAAVLRFKGLGINELVKELELTELSNYIASKLRDMTGQKRKDIDENLIQSSRKSPRLTPTSRALVLALQPESIAAANHGLFDHPSYSLVPTSMQESSDSQGSQDENSSGSTIDDFIVPYDTLNCYNFNSPTDSELFIGQCSSFL